MLANSTDKMLVPRSAVTMIDGKSAVFVIEDSKAVAKSVVIVDNDGKQAAIDSGVEVGTKVISNANGITNGQAVTVK